ncbi:UDP-N-acetylglucosamine 2-epimerase [Prauserella flavalba]|uniref:UDP-N-acetylglucosamine 2-epimerase n=1 Tax=Prauserella flavalba TaxID=1477506 RepID=UPI0036EFE277
MINIKRDRRSICVFTGSRADYGPIAPLARRLSAEAGVDLTMLVSGGHLVPNQGMTIDAIRADGLEVEHVVDINLAGDSATSICKSFGLGCIGYADALDRIKPDIVLITGDRYEALAMAVVSAQQGIAIVHVGGGQLTFGSIDDRMRHAISKLANVHFVGCEDDRRRLVRMGESPDSIFTIPGLGLDHSVLDGLLEKPVLEEELRLELTFPSFLVTFHPATADPVPASSTVRELLSALDEIPGAKVVFTAPNADREGEVVSRAIQRWVATNQHRSVFVPSLGQIRYLSLMWHAHLVLGNSSSGLTESPVLGTPAVNIGSRQDGRPRSPSVVDCEGTTNAIEKAIDIALALPRRRPSLERHIRECAMGVEQMLGVLTTMNAGDLRAKVFFEE